MSSLARIFFTKSDGGEMDTVICGALDVSHVVTFLDATAHCRTAEVEEVLFTPDGYMTYDRSAGFVRKTPVYNVPPSSTTSGFLGAALTSGYACNVVARVLIQDPYRHVSVRGFRWVTIPGPVDEVEEYGPEIAHAFGAIFLCNTLRFDRMNILSTRQDFLFR